MVRVVRSFVVCVAVIYAMVAAAGASFAIGFLLARLLTSASSLRILAEVFVCSGVLAIAAIPFVWGRR